MSDNDTTPRGAGTRARKNALLRPPGLLAGLAALAVAAVVAFILAQGPRTPPPSPEPEPSEREAVGNRTDSPILIFEESPPRGLEEQAKAADLLLIGLLRERSIPLSRLQLADVEAKSLNGERYHFQTLRADLDGDQAAFVDALAERLRLKGLNATTAETGAGSFMLMIGGVPTHLFTTAPHEPPPPAPGPKMAIVIDDIGENMRIARGLADLPYPVTLSVWPRGSHTADAVRLAKDKGLEVMLHQPMEPVSYPRDNPGPGALFTDMTREQIQNTVNANLDLVPGAVGANNHMGSNFTRWGPGMAAALDVLKKRGVFFLDSWTHRASKGEREARALGLAFYRRSVFLDNVRDPEAILHQLAKTERLALKTGQAIAIGHPHPETLAALQAWADRRNQTVSVVQVRALAPM